MAEENKKEEGAQQEEQKQEEKPLEEMTVKELREVARDVPTVTGVSSMKKEELLDALKKAQEGETEAAGVAEAVEEPPGEVEGVEEVAEKVEEKEKPLDRMTAKELREIAREIPGVEGVHAMKKEQLLEIIKKARGIKEEAPVRKGEKEPAEKVSVVALKQKIMLLKQEKEAAREAKDRKKVDILRRRINRLKKRTRKATQAQAA